MTLANDGRTGALVDLGGGDWGTSSVGAVTVDGSGAQYGFVLQNGTFPVGWDTGVTRMGATVANDAARSADLPVGGGAFVPMPPAMPCP